MVLQETHLWLWKIRSHGNSLFFSPHPLDFNMFIRWFSAWKMLKATNSANISICLLWSSVVNKYQNGTSIVKVAKKASNMGRSGTQYVAMVILKSTFRRILLHSIKRFWYKVAEISFFIMIIFEQVWLSVWRHHLANLLIWKTWISLERKEIFENSKQHFSSHEVCLFISFKMA